MCVSDVFIHKRLITDIARICRHDVASTKNWGVVDVRKLAPEFSLFHFLIWATPHRLLGF
jgi:hypothetical protein